MDKATIALVKDRDEGGWPGDKAEQDLFIQLHEYFTKKGLSVVLLHGPILFEFKPGAKLSSESNEGKPGFKTPDENERDFLILVKEYNLIINIEVKATLNSGKAGEANKQLKISRDILKKNFGQSESQDGAQIKFVGMVYSDNIDDLDQFCQRCSQFVLHQGNLEDNLDKIFETNTKGELMKT